MIQSMLGRVSYATRTISQSIIKFSVSLACDLLRSHKTSVPQPAVLEYLAAFSTQLLI